jgi:hypothetical protein
LDTGKIKKLDEGCERIPFQMTAMELTHLVLSIKEQYSFLGNLYGSHELFNTIVEKIGSTLHSKIFDVQADTFFTLYQVR